MSLLGSKNVSLEGSTLNKTSGANNWDACAVFHAESGDMEYSVRLIRSRDRYAMIGFAPSSIDMKQGVFSYQCGHFIYLATLDYYGPEECSMSWKLEGRLAVGQTLHLRFTHAPQPAIYASIECSGFKQVPIPNLAPGEYRPCILIRCPETVLAISLADPVTLRGGPDPKLARIMLKEMWRDTSFSDCRVVCGEKVLPCHRIVLATASPVWRTALQGSFRESQEATINIQDAKPSDVEALVQYAYTGGFDDANAAALLPLAHRYEMPDLVGRCGRLMLSQLSVDNVAHTVSAINTFSEHAEVAPLWSRLVEKVSSDPKLTEVAMRHVRP